MYYVQGFCESPGKGDSAGCEKGGQDHPAKLHLQLPLSDCDSVSSFKSWWGHQGLQGDRPDAYKADKTRADLSFWVKSFWKCDLKVES